MSQEGVEKERFDSCIHFDAHIHEWKSQALRNRISLIYQESESFTFRSLA